MADDGEETRDPYEEFLRRTKEPDSQARTDDPTSWRTFGLRLAAFLVAATVIVLFFQSDTGEARAERAAWLRSCGGGDECAATADEWHDLCFYRRAAGRSQMDKMPNFGRRNYRAQQRRPYDPQEYRRCMDGHARDFVTGLRVDEMLRKKEEAARRHEAGAE